MNPIDFSEARRQSPKGLVLIFLQQTIQLFRSWWPAFIYLFIKVKGENKWLIIAAGLGIFLVLTLIHSILYFRNYKYQITGENFILNKGYINRKTLTIPLERIQNVETNQSVLQKMLKVMGIEIDTAGTSKKELKILALDDQTAVQLARELTVQIRDSQTGDEDKNGENSVPEKEILRLTNRDLLKIGISQNHLRAALLILAFGNQIFNQIKDLFAERAEEVENNFGEFLEQSEWLIIVIMIFGFLLISFLFSMIRTAVLFYDLRFLKSGSTYRIVSGLFNRKNTLVPFKKIQQLDWETGPLKRLFGIYQINIRQASSTLSQRNQSIELPGCLDPHLDLILTDLFGDEGPDTDRKIHAHRRYFIRNWIISGWIPALLATPLYIFHAYYIAVGVVWLAGMAFLAHWRQKRTYFFVNQDQIRSSSGSIAHKMKQMRFHKVQQIELQQSFFMRRRGLANLKIGNSSGNIRLPYVDLQLAKSLQDYLLYYAETSNEEWI